MLKVPTAEVFMEAARLLNNKWARRFAGQEAILSRLSSFVDFYIKDEANRGWYSAFSEFASQNNGLECANRDFKDRDTLRKRLPIRQFFDVASSAVHKWSISPDLQVLIYIFTTKF